jgi:hypothetical protein
MLLGVVALIRSIFCRECLVAGTADHNEYGEREHALCRWREQQPSQSLSHADQQTAEQRARHRTQPAGNDNDKGQKRVGGADHRRDIDDQCHHDAGGADASSANPEGERIDSFYVESDNERASMIIGAGTYRFAERRETKKRK